MDAVLFDVDDDVCTVTLNRPERRNAVDGPMAAELLAAFERFDADDDLAVAVLTGAGGTFCAGADLGAIGDPERRHSVDPDWGAWSAKDYVRLLDHPIAEQGYRRDMDAMERVDTFVLVLPCGRSAHLELGWAAGAGKRTIILTQDG